MLELTHHHVNVHKICMMIMVNARNVPINVSDVTQMQLTVQNVPKIESIHQHVIVQPNTSTTESIPPVKNVTVNVTHVMVSAVSYAQVSE